MSTPLLTTELRIPLLRPNLVASPRLVERLGEGLRVVDREDPLIDSGRSFIVVLHDYHLIEAQRWYRHHHLFAGLLRRPLK